MDLGPGPPQQSPDDYSERERQERTGVAVGISVGVLILFTGPLILLYFANWRRKRRNKKKELRDLEGTTVVSHDEKNGTAQTEHTEATEFTTTVVANEDLMFTEAEIAKWRDLHRYSTGTELERLKRDPTSPLNIYSTPDSAKQATPEELLGLDKTSYLQSLPIASSSHSASDKPTSITVLPSQLPSVGLNDFKGESSKQTEKSAHFEECISPWAVEHEPNPVIFKHLLGPRGERLGQGEVATQSEDTVLQNEAYPEHFMDLEVNHGRNEQAQQHIPDKLDIREEEGVKDSSTLQETSSSSPTSSTDSQDSAHPLLSRRSDEEHSESPNSYTFHNMYDQLGRVSDSGQYIAQGPGRTLCSPCNRTFKTTGQLNAHIHRKHVRRYSCAICPSTFHLKTDLKRHELTVHRKYLPAETRGFRCPNQGCSIPEKIFLRRDNFERHVARCARRVEGEEMKKNE